MVSEPDSHVNYGPYKLKSLRELLGIREEGTQQGNARTFTRQVDDPIVDLAPGRRPGQTTPQQAPQTTTQTTPQQTPQTTPQQTTSQTITRIGVEPVIRARTPAQTQVPTVTIQGLTRGDTGEELVRVFTRRGPNVSPRFHMRNRISDQDVVLINERSTGRLLLTVTFCEGRVVINTPPQNMPENTSPQDMERILRN